jgi:hypothetical protein
MLSKRATLTQNSTAQTMATMPGCGPGAAVREGMGWEGEAVIKTSDERFRKNCACWNQYIITVCNDYKYY